MGGWVGIREAAIPGCITSTPKLLDFLKKQRFWAKNERASCMPGAKNGERPYLAAPEPGFLDPKIRSFSTHSDQQPPILSAFQSPTFHSHINHAYR